MKPSKPQQRNSTAHFFQPSLPKTKLLLSLNPSIKPKQLHKPTQNYFCTPRSFDFIFPFRKSKLVKEIRLRASFKPIEADYRQGFALTALNRHEEALSDFTHVAQLDPDIKDIYYNLGIVLTNLERFEEALATFNKTLELNPTDAEAYTNKGKMLTALDRHKEAQDAFNKALQLNPSLSIDSHHPLTLTP